MKVADIKAWLRSYAVVKRWLLFVVGAVLLAVGHYAHAATNLAMVCTDSDAAGKNSSTAVCVNRTWKTPTAADYVMSAGSTSTSTWGNADAKHRQLSALVSGNTILRCTLDLADPTLYSAQQCKSNQSWVTYTPSTTTPTTPTTPTAEGNGIATLTWTAPTQNTDGTALTDLIGYRVYQGTTADNLAVIADVSKDTLKYVVSGLASGTYYWAVTAVNAANVESAKTSQVAKIVKQSTPGEVTLTISVSASVP